MNSNTLFKYILACILLLNYIVGCEYEVEEDIFSILNNNVRQIKIESDYGKVDINDVNSISKIIDWLRQSKILNTKYASYPSTDMKLILIKRNDEHVVIHSSFPSYSNIPIIVKYNNIYYMTGEHPEIPVFKFFREKTNPDNL